MVNLKNFIEYRLDESDTSNSIKDKSLKDTDSRHEFLARCFNAITSNVLNRHKQWLLNQVNNPIKSEIRDLKKISKMEKFQKHNYLKENKLSQIEQILSCANLNKRKVHIFNEFLR